jgi:tyrosine-protein kinase Etk/Wzc
MAALSASLTSMRSTTPNCWKRISNTGSARRASSLRTDPGIRRAAQQPHLPGSGTCLPSISSPAFILSLLIVLVRYILHDNITSLHDIAKPVQRHRSILGMVPKYKKEIPMSQLLIDKNPKSLIAESFRTMRTNLQFVDNTDGAKTIAITSTISGEGKTFVAINLAGIISPSAKARDHPRPGHAQAEDPLGLRRGEHPRHEHLADRQGRHWTIASSKAPCKDLDFITAGPIPPNPSELIISEAHEQR